MQITLYENFSKKSNSTKIPSYDGTVVDCFLKDSTSFSSPIFILTTSTLSVTYVKWNDRYYYVDSIASIKNGVVELSCSLDVLATYKNDILNITAFVEYSTSKFNADILDTRISTSEKLISKTSYGSESLNRFSKTGCYRVSINGGGNSQFYYLSNSSLKSLANDMSNITDSDIIDSLVLKFGSVFSAINGCVYLPFTLPSTEVSGIFIGDYQTSVAGFVTENYYFSQSATLKIPWIFDEKCRRITEQIYLYLPSVGTVRLDSSELINSENITIICYYDYVDGNISYTVKFDGKTLYYNSSVGTPIEFGISVKNLKGSLISDTWKGFSTIFSLKDISAIGRNYYGSNASLYNIVNSKINAVGNSYSTIGSLGSYCDGARAGENSQVFITNKAFNFACNQSDIADTNGRPLFSITSLKNLTGYCKCSGASIECACEENERMKINTYINNGFFIE